MDSNFMTCANCGKDLTEEESRSPCPDCGSMQRKGFTTIEFKASSSISKISAKARDSTGFMKDEERMRRGHSKKSGEPVIITIDEDRTDPEYTKVLHKVEGLEDGIVYGTLHEDTKIGEAKHRPKENE